MIDYDDPVLRRPRRRRADVADAVLVGILFVAPLLATAALLLYAFG